MYENNFIGIGDNIQTYNINVFEEDPRFLEEIIENPKEENEELQEKVSQLMEQINLAEKEGKKEQQGQTDKRQQKIKKKVGSKEQEERIKKQKEKMQKG
jgi:hypothetical protein